MKKIAITGGIGSGKSTVAKQIALLGFPVFSCDEIYRELLQDNAYIAQISRVFSDVVKEGVIDKKALSRRVFSSETDRKRLNSIAHPLIMERLYARMSACTNELVFAEVPLLFEGGYENDFAHIIVVRRNDEERIESVMKRDGVSKAEVLARLSVQFDYKDIKNKNVYFIDNDSGIEELELKTKQMILQLKKA